MISGILVFPHCQYYATCSKLLPNKILKLSPVSSAYNRNPHLNLCFSTTALIFFRTIVLTNFPVYIADHPSLSGRTIRRCVLPTGVLTCVEMTELYTKDPVQTERAQSSSSSPPVYSAGCYMYSYSFSAS